MFLLIWVGSSCDPVPQFLVSVSLFKLHIPGGKKLNPPACKVFLLLDQLSVLGTESGSDVVAGTL